MEERKLRDIVMEAYGVARSFRWLDPNDESGEMLKDQIKAAKETGCILERKIEEILRQLPK